MSLYLNISRGILKQFGAGICDSSFCRYVLTCPAGCQFCFAMRWLGLVLAQMGRQFACISSLQFSAGLLNITSGQNSSAAVRLRLARVVCIIVSLYESALRRVC